MLDAAVRSWPPVKPKCLRWEFPVFHLADDLNPADIKRPRSRRMRAPKEAKPEIPEWTVEQFVERFVASEPETKQAIVDLARAEGISERKASDLLRRAAEAGQVHRWIEERNKPQRFATVAPGSIRAHRPRRRYEVQADHAGGETAPEKLAFLAAAKHDLRQR